MRGRVLIVDDDKGMCDVLEAGLKHRDFATVARLSAEDALAILGAEDFDAVVTDLNMKSMNGLELCQRITANRPNVPVVVITAFASLDAAVATIRAGASRVQLYTSFAYLGPALIPRLKAELATSLRATGFARIEDAVGTGAQELLER